MSNQNQPNQVAVIGLAPMGKNFAKNFASRGIQTAIYNRSFEKTQEILDENNENIQGYADLKECIHSLQSPRKIFLLVKAGAGTDQTVEQILPFLDKGDILVDCGNTLYKDTIQRQQKLEAVGIHFVGCGISGGYEGALKGPSLMPGGQPEVVNQLLEVLKPVSAKDFNGDDCVTNVGLAGAGHFVKMVHNGIEYAMMQGIAEVYDVLKNLGISNPEAKMYFERINTGQNKSFLLDITVDILGAMDKIGNPQDSLLDMIDSRAGAKGTGKWTVEAGMELGVAVPNIYAGLNARVMSEVWYQYNQQSEKLNIAFKDREGIDPEILVSMLNNLMYSIFVTSYWQGILLIDQANKDYNWNIDMAEVLRIWQGGCIIRSQLLVTLTELYKTSGTQFPSAIFGQCLLNIINFERMNLFVDIAPARPVIDSAKNYLTTILSNTAPQNLVQAQRDHFGSHTYKRIDQEGIFTNGWN
jgi:6-phosphogluconate dehydrogenase